MDSGVEVDDRKILALIEDTPVKKTDYTYVDDMKLRLADSRSDLE